MKKNILSLLVIALAIFSDLQLSAQSCTEVQDKSFTLQGSVNGPCAIYTARDNVTLKPGFTLSGGTKIVKFTWNTTGSYTPQLRIGSFLSCSGTTLPANYNMGDLVNSFTALKNNLTTRLGTGYIVQMNICGTSCAWISVENLSDFSDLGNYTSKETQPFQLPNTSFTAKVDNSLLFPVSYLNSYDIPDPTTRQPNTSLPFGSIAGSFNVSPSGGATYEIPIEVPIGLGGLEPKLAIAYNSQIGNGLLGWGCNLSGLSAITRVPQNLYSDNAVTGLAIDGTDRFALDGNRLVLAKETDIYGAENTSYRTENETFIHIISHDGFGSGPGWFEVYDKKGTKYKYGSQGGYSLYLASTGWLTFKTATLTWYLDYVEDVFGNTISYTYTSEQNGLVTFLKTITYGTNKSGVGTTSAVDFFYEIRQDPINFHYFPLNGQIDKVLNRVVTRTGNQILRTYDLAYTKDAFTRLSKVIESNGAGVQLNPTYLKWGDYKSAIVNQSTYTLPTDQYYSQVDFSQRNWTTGDVNGDGLTDLISFFPYKNYISGSTYNQVNKVQIFTASIGSDGNVSFSIGQSYEFLPSMVWSDFNCYSSIACTQNINGDNTPDIVVPYFNKVSGLFCQIGFFALNARTDIPVFSQNLLESTTEMPKYAIGDLNNDGIQDIIYVENSKSNNTYQGKIHYSTSNPNWSNPINNVWLPFNIALNNPPKNIFIGDYNADGLNDIMVVNDDGYYIYRNINGIISTSPIASSTLFNSTYSTIRPGDFNGDGLQDFVLNEQDSPNWYFALNNGNLGFIKIALPLITAFGQGFTDKDNTVDNCLVTDFNNDGKSDVIIFDGNYDKHCDLSGCWGTFNNFRTYWYKSTGDNVSLEKIAISPNESDTPFSRYVVGDFNGDGRGDLMNFGYDCYGGIDMTQKWRMYATPNTNYEGGMVTSISNGLGQNTSIAYTTTSAKSNYSTDVTLPSGTPTYPLSLLGNSVYLVKSVTVPNGMSSPVVQTYTYSNGVVDLQRGFMGFGKFTVTNSLNNASTEQNYEFKLTSGTGTYNTYYQPFLTSTKSKVGATVVSETSIPLANYSVTPIAGLHRHVFMYPTKTIQTDYLKKSITTTTTSLDSDGNVLSAQTGTTDNPLATVVASQNTTYNGYSKKDDPAINLNPFKNAPDNVVTQQTHKDTPGTFSVTTALTYYPNGTLKNKTDFASTPAKALTTSFTYDAVGNLLTTTTGDRTTTLEYTPDKRFVSKQYDALNHFTETAYDCWGNPLLQWDMNRLQTTYQYDDWGRLKSVTAPDGQKVTSTTDWFDKGNATSYKHPNTLYYSSSFDEDNHFISAEYYDAAGYSRRKAASGFNGRISFSDVTYNPKGQVYTVSDPYPAGGTPTKLTTNTTYDSYGRLTVQTLSNLVTVTTAYSDDNSRKITTTNSTGETYSKEYDAAGLLTKATDPGGSITYTYYSTGKPATIQPAGGAGATTITYYTETGLQKTLSDPSSGSNSYDYNNFGELTSQTDGNSKTTTMTYDKLSRVLTKTTGSIVAKFNYDDIGAIGLLKSIVNPSYPDNPELSYKYDPLGRLTQETRSKGTEAFTYKYEYDSKSRVSKLTYPNTMALTYGYNINSGDLTSIAKDGVNIWALGTTTADVNDLGQVAKVTLGNGKATLYGYDTQNRLSSIAVDNILNFGYVFNNKQQLVSRNEKMYNGTAMAGFTETFTYDGVNRLLTATKDNGNTPLVMTYKTVVNDRIETKSDAATFNYTDLSKYKVSTISNLKILFPQHNLTYNDEGRTTLVTETNGGVINKTLTLDYGLDGQRFKTEYTQDGTRRYTRYYFDTYEKEVMADGATRHLNYIYAGGTLIAIFEQKTGGDKMHYVYTDYLSSLRCITSDNGTIEQRLSYDAWGNRRNYLDGLKLTDLQLAEAITLTSRGFTGQEHVDGLGLINLNARFYDPALGMFCSPDNYVQLPDNSQGFNRYSYCLNNPFVYVDPDGNNPVIIAAIIIGAVAGGYTGYKVADAKGYNMGDWQTYGYMLGGAVIGGFSGYAGATIAAGGGFMANTMGIMYSSSFSSLGMSVMSGGMIQPSVSFGIASYNFGTNDWGYLGEKGNSVLANIGYGFGALTNLSDVVSLFGGGTNADLIVQKKDAVSHSALVNEKNGIDISVGPYTELGEGINMNALLGKENGLSGSIKELARTMKGKIWENHARDGNGWKLPLNNLNRKILANMSKNLQTGMNNKTLMWNLLGKSCVGYTSKALWSVGVINLGGIHPYWLQLQMAIRQAGIYSSPYLYQIP
jgi:RHS repeat-associated protein